MELIELDATAQRALELLTNAGMSDGSILFEQAEKVSPYFKGFSCYD